VLGVVLDVAVAVDSPSTVPIDPNVITGNNKTGMVILESYGIGVIAPVCQVRRVL
jgi:hypothetical protein